MKIKIISIGFLCLSIVNVVFSETHSRSKTLRRNADVIVRYNEVFNENDIWQFKLKTSRYAGKAFRPSEEWFVGMVTLLGIVDIPDDPVNFSCDQIYVFNRTVDPEPNAFDFYGVQIKGSITDRCHTPGGPRGGGRNSVIRDVNDSDFKYTLENELMFEIKPIESFVFVGNWLRLWAHQIGDPSSLVPIKWSSNAPEGSYTVLHSDEDIESQIDQNTPGTDEIYFHSPSPGSFQVYGRLYNEETGEVSDNSWGLAVVNVSSMDLNIDSDNNNGLDEPDRSEDEEEFEFVDGHPGKALFINHLDRDKDAVPDYADGIDKDWGFGSELSVDASHGFVPILIRYDSSIDVDSAKIMFVCDQISNPAEDVDYSEGVFENTFSLIGGKKIRIWRKKGEQARGTKSVTEGGDAVLHNEGFLLSLLSPTEGEAVVYVEALTGSDELGDIQIELKLNTEGTDDIEDFHTVDKVKATVFDVEKLNPLNDDFQTGHAGRVLISAKHGGGFYTPFQTTNAVVNIKAKIKPTPPMDWDSLTVYFEVIDPDDLSHYEGPDPVPSDPNQQQDSIPNDNRDPNKKMENGVGVDYADFQISCLGVNGRSSLVEVDEEGAFARTKLKITNRYSGDNYQVRATLQKPHNLEPFDTRSSLNGLDRVLISDIAESATLVAWKRVYIEFDKMYKSGTHLNGDADANARTLSVESIRDFKSGESAILFWKEGEKEVEIEELVPRVVISGGGGSGALARVDARSGTIDYAVVDNGGEGYTSVPELTVVGDSPLIDAELTAVLKPTGINLDVIDGGHNYETVPLVTVSAPEDEGGRPVAYDVNVVDGQLSITVTDVGSGYRSTPEVNVFSLDSGAGAEVKASLLPTEVEGILIVNSGGGYLPGITLTEEIGIDLPIYSGLRPTIEPETYNLSLQKLTDAYGLKPNGEDGGAFIEFKMMPNNKSKKVPYVHIFTEAASWGLYSNYWFDNIDYSEENCVYLLAANENDFTLIPGGDAPLGTAFSLYHPEYPSITCVWVGMIDDEEFRDYAVVHEITHRFNILKGDFGYVDTQNGPKNHEDTAWCLMSYNNIEHDVTEFGVSLMFSGFEHNISLRDFHDE